MLAGLVRAFSPNDWRRPTPFKQWTPWDVIAHLYLSDQLARVSLRSRADFGTEIAPLLAAVEARTPLRDFARQRFAGIDGPSLLAAWSETLCSLCADLESADPGARLAWIGGEMGVRSFATARYMETWAHAQDIFDLLGRKRSYTDDIQAIATLGARTFAFSFRNRGLPVPQPLPYLRLTAPSGAIWEWNEASDTDRVEGLASEFCHVVTQNRNVADTALRVVGNSARQWMAIAQCFAGPPETPPTPGTRNLRS